MASNTSGALIGPLMSGFASQISWQWPFWIAGIIAAQGILLLILLPENFAPVLYNKTMLKRVKCNNSAEVTEELALLQLFDLQKIFPRPITLMVSEPILLLSSLYLALAYAILYLMFQAYPLVFEGKEF
jgi:MFS family permease